MDRKVSLATICANPFALHDPPAREASTGEKSVLQLHTNYDVDDERHSLSVGGTQVNSPVASIHDGKEGHDVEKVGNDLNDIDIYDPNRPKFNFSRRM